MGQFTVHSIEVLVTTVCSKCGLIDSSTLKGITVINALARHNLVEDCRSCGHQQIYSQVPPEKFKVSTSDADNNARTKH